MKRPTSRLIVGMMLAAAVAVSAPTAYGARGSKKALAPTRSDCIKRANAAAEKARKEGKTEAEQQAAYERAKYNCMERM